MTTRSPSLPAWLRQLPLVLGGLLLGALGAVPTYLFGGRLLAQGADPAVLLALLVLLLGLLGGVAAAATAALRSRLTERLATVQEERDGLYRRLRAEVQAGQHREEHAAQTQRHHEETLRTLRADLDAHQADLDRADAVRARLEAAWRESEARWRTLVQRHPEPLLISQEDRIVYANAAALRLLGAEDGTVLRGRAWRSLLPDGVQVAYERRSEALAQGVLPPPLTHPLVDLKGQERFVETFAVPCMLRGRPTVQTIVRDVTHRRELEGSLQHYTHRLQARTTIEGPLLDGAPLRRVARATLDALHEHLPIAWAGVLTFVPREHKAHVTDMLEGGPASWQPGRALPLSDVAPPRPFDLNRTQCIDDLHAVELRAALEEQLVEAGMRTYAFVPLRSQGALRGALLLGAPEAAALDDAHLATAYEAGALLSLAVQQAHTERERQRYENEIVTAKEEAEELARMKSTFLASMSHEIRTPLTSIIGFAQILHEEIDDAHREFTDLIEESAHRLLETTNSVLNLARLEANRMTLNLEALDLAEEVQRTVQLLTPLARQWKLDLHVDTPETPVTAFLDANALSRVVTNLVSNALKFTEEGSVRVEVTSADDQAVIRVRDTGVGIDEAFLPHLFTEFRQERAHTPPNRPSGSGLGLSITKRLVELMQGTISVTSTPGEGTCISVAFRLAKGEAPEELPSLGDDLRLLDGDRSTRPRPQRMLYVADAEAAGVTMRALLHEGFDVEVVSTVKEALRRTRAQRFSAIVLDVDRVKRQVATHVLHTVRDLPLNAQTPVVALTARPDGSTEQRYLQAGFAAYAPKLAAPRVLRTLAAPPSPTSSAA